MLFCLLPTLFCVQSLNNCEPSQLPGANEVIDLAGELITTTLPNQANPQLHSNDLSLSTQKSVVLTPHKGNISLQQTETTTEKYNPSKCRAVEVRPNGYIYITTPSPKAQGSLQKRGKKTVRPRETGSLL